ncbi:MAG: hypothetical protein KAX38_07095 [Candidatus Krumholzibacteria bacterium]|nr:hypothetical protein [Candidatus Krumholzibacteria bacterium]
MNEGLIGFIIIIIVLNLGGRILRALTAGKAKTVPKGTGKPGEETPSELFDTERVESYESAGLDEPLKHDGGEAPGDLNEWREDRFEESGIEAPDNFDKWSEELFEGSEEVFGYDQKVAVEPVPVDLPTGTEAERGKTSPKLIYSDLRDVEGLRKAIVLSTILGPCRAKRRRRPLTFS